VLQLATTPCDFSSSSGPNCYSSSDAVSLPVYFSPPDNSMVTATPLSDLLVIEKLREQELEEARIIQGAMLPSQPLHIGNVIISHEFQPVTEVGGDYLDYFALSDSKIGLYVGDVSGKGLPAALYAALAVGTLRGVHKTGLLPARVLSLLNERLLLRGIPGRHTAIQYALFNPETAEMRIVSAGMPGPLLLRNQQCQVLQITGIPPGLFPCDAYDEFVLQLHPGDSLLFCTDGLTEARNIHDQEFGLEGLQDVCSRYWADAPLDLLGHAFSAIQEFTRHCRQWDDMTAAVFHYSSR
jgi:phosphoserine phosphatase RsbU/P